MIFGASRQDGAVDVDDGHIPSPRSRHASFSSRILLSISLVGRVGIGKSARRCRPGTGRLKKRIADWPWDEYVRASLV